MRWILNVAMAAAAGILVFNIMAPADRLPAPSWPDGYQDYFDRHRP